MPEWRIIAVIGVLGAVSYALRAGGYLVAAGLPKGNVLPRVLRLASGNLFVAFVAGGIHGGGWPSLCGCLASVTAMALTGREWVALAAGFGAAAAGSLLQG
jgi:hypothetical protein